MPVRLPAALAPWLIAAATLLAVIHVLGWDFVRGTGLFWQSPRGSIGHGWADMATALTGYQFFQRGSWQFPLLAIPQLGIPDGTNVTFTDGIPVLALCGRLLFALTGHAVNLLGLWIAACLAGSAGAMVLLARLLGARGAAAALCAAILGFCMPALLFRWGHPALMAQFEITLSFALYVARRRDPASWPLFAATAALCLLALLTNSYLFLMVGGISFAFYCQAAIDRSQAWSRRLGELSTLGALLAATMLACGLLGSGGTLRAEGFGIFSSNLLGPFLPQRSGLVPGLDNFVADATGGQYEGFCYLGAGLLLLAALAAAGHTTSLRAQAARHACLLLFVLLCTAFSLSDRIYFGPWQVLHVPLPEKLHDAAAVVRSSGRFTWPLLYLTAAWCIAAVARMRFGTAWLLAACLLQWTDTAPLRATIARDIAHPAPPPVAFSALRRAEAAHKAVWVLPSFACLADPPGWSKALALEAQLAAASAFVPINSVYQSRHSADCAQERRGISLPGPEDADLHIFLPELRNFETLRAAAGTGAHCVASPRIILCGSGTNTALRAASVPDQAWQPPSDTPWQPGAAHAAAR